VSFLRKHAVALLQKYLLLSGFYTYRSTGLRNPTESDEPASTPSDKPACTQGLDYRLKASLEAGESSGQVTSDGSATLQEIFPGSKIEKSSFYDLAQ